MSPTYTGKEDTRVVLEVPEGYREEGRLDVYITRFVQNASRTKVQKSIKKGLVTVNGEVVTKPAHTVQATDTIVCTIERPPPVEARPEPIPLDVVYEDAYLIVVNKPAGMVVHPAYGHRSGTLVNALLYHVGSETIRMEDVDEDDLDDEDLGLSTIQAAPPRPGNPSIRPGIVHRLDKDTSGLLVVAKDDVTHAGLAKQFQDRTTRRSYQALVWGVPDPPRGTIEAPIGRDPRDRKRMAVVAEGNGKHAITHYAVREAFSYTSLLQFRLETGRTHQIRVHAQHAGHPVLGDPTYGGQAVRRGPSTRNRRAFYENLFAVMPRQALHAHTLGFTHPRTGEEVDVAAALPEDMQYVLKRVREVEGGPIKNV